MHVLCALMYLVGGSRVMASKNWHFSGSDKVPLSEQVPY